MKKLITILLLFALTFSIISCNKKAPPTGESETSGESNTESSMVESNDGSTDTDGSGCHGPYTITWSVEEYKKNLEYTIPCQFFAHYDMLPEWGEPEPRWCFSALACESCDRPLYTSYGYYYYIGPYPDYSNPFEFKIKHFDKEVFSVYGAKEIDSNERIDLRDRGNFDDGPFTDGKYYISYSVQSEKEEAIFYWLEILLTYDSRGWLKSIEWTADDAFELKMFLETGKTENLGLDISYKLEFYNGTGLLGYDMSNEELNKFLYSDTIGEAVYNLTDKFIFGDKAE